MGIEQKILKAVLLLRKRGNKSQTKEEQIEEVKSWVRDGAMTEHDIDEWINDLKEDQQNECFEEDYWEDKWNYDDEKEYGPSNPWDAPGMCVSDFI